MHKGAAVRAAPFLFQLQIRFSGFNQSGEASRIIHGDVSQNLAVQLAAGLLQTVHETAVRNVIQMACRIDTGDPQTTEISLFLTAADIGISHGVHDSSLCTLVLFGTSTIEALRQGQNSFMFFTSV